jgi:hypothetical protein
MKNGKDNIRYKSDPQLVNPICWEEEEEEY